MKIYLIAIGKHRSDWITTGFKEYAKRLPKSCQLILIEMPLPTRTKNADINKLRQQEGEQMLKLIPSNTVVIALDVKGQLWQTEKLVQQLQQWRNQAVNISLLIGGPDGLAPSCLEHASLHWSLSPLTLPHGLVRIIVAEQLYRAWSILAGHPYHR